MNAIKVYKDLVFAVISGQMQYKTSFWMTMVGSFFASFIDVIGLVLIFDRFGMINGWGLAEICLLYGAISIPFALTEAFARGFDTFGRLIQTGALDRMLVRPQPIILQVLGSEFKLANAGRLLQGVIPFVYAVGVLEIFSLWQWALIALAFINGVGIFYALLLSQATWTFWSVESIEVMNAFTYGGIQMAQFPLSIYEKWFAHLFTYVIPVGLATYFPMLLVLNKQGDAYSGQAAFLTLLGPFLIGSLVYLAHLFFRYGLSKYHSTGS